jgi:hypothetical protein
LVFTYKGQRIILRNRVKYTGVGIDEIAKRYFSPKKVDLSKFSEKERRAIRVAQVIPGMSKKAVLIALGTPPAHVTPSTEMNQWRYWRTRWSTFFINFKDGKATNSSTDVQKNNNHGLILRVR